MSRFVAYALEQAYLLPPTVREELGEDHLCFFIGRVVGHLDLSGFEQAYSLEGGELYHPAMMLSVWLYAYAVGITSARRVERRVVEDLAFRYLAGGAKPDNWALSAFRRRHGRALNDVFTQVLEMARQLGMGNLGRVAIDATRIQAHASPDRVDTEQKLRNERARLRRQVRRWQKACDGDDGEAGGQAVAIAAAEQELAGLPRRLQQLRKSGLKKRSRTDEDARFLRQRGGYVLGYTAEIAVSDDHVIVAQQVTQNASDNDSLQPLVEQVEQRCGAPVGTVLADSGFFSGANVKVLEERGIEVYVPDPTLAHELNTGQRAKSLGCTRIRNPRLRRLRQKLRSPAGRATYARRKAIVEPVFGVLKQQRGMRQFRARTLAKVGIEFTLAALAYNLTRIYVRQCA
jgi:transposase